MAMSWVAEARQYRPMTVHSNGPSSADAPLTTSRLAAMASSGPLIQRLRSPHRSTSGDHRTLAAQASERPL